MNIENIKLMNFCLYYIQIKNNFNVKVIINTFIKCSTQKTQILKIQRPISKHLEKKCTKGKTDPTKILPKHQ